MMRSAGLMALGLAALAGGVAGARTPGTDPGVAPGPVPAATCGECHRGKHQRWSSGRHSRMLQPAGPDSVLGDFTRGRVRLRGETYELRAHGGGYTIAESYLSGERRERRVEYTLGSRRVQHYLTTLEDGRIVVLPPTWDVQRRQWFHNLDIVAAEEDGRAAPALKVQVWNSACLGCHVSHEEKGYDPARGAYATTWGDYGASCERCHGTGAGHVEAHRAPGAAGGPAAAPAMVVASRLPPERATAVCAQCHSLRDVSAPGFTAGADYFDHFLPVLEYGQKDDGDPAYWADGRPRRFSNDAIGLWQSACYVRGGATCTTCHSDPHMPDVERNPQLAPSDSRLCLSCHADKAAALETHTRHRAGSPGSSCVECHMPPTVVSIKARMRDHAISAPSPEATVRFGVPNACNACHADRDARWAARALQAWGRAAGSRTLRRAAAFDGARRGDAAAVAALSALARDQGEPPLARANALGHLRRFPGAPASAVLAAALKDPHPMPRAVAAFTLAEVGESGSAAAEPLIAALGDPSRVVRMAAALALINRRVRPLTAAAETRLQEARRDHLARSGLLLDHAPAQLDRGKLLLLDGDASAAAGAFAAALKLDPELPGGRYLMGLALAAAGRTAEALAELRRVPAGDPFRTAAEQAERRLQSR